MAALSACAWGKRGNHMSFWVAPLWRRYGETIALWLTGREGEGRAVMQNLNQIKITPPDEQVLRLLVQECSNKEIASQLSISPRTVKQHLRDHVPARAQIRDGRKWTKLATAMFLKEQSILKLSAQHL